MYETIYEIEKFTLPEDSIIFAIGIIILCVFTSDILIDIIEAMKKNNLLLSQGIKKFCALLLVVVGLLWLVLMFISSLSYGGSDNFQFSKKYYDGEYKVVEGKVDNYIGKFSDDKHEHYEEFDVKNIHFEYGHAYKVGFQNENDVIYQNGQDVRVYYISENDGNETMNVIVKIEEKLNKDNIENHK